MAASLSASEILAGPHRRELIDDGDGLVVIVEPLRFVPVYPFACKPVVGRPVIDWRRCAETLATFPHEPRG